MRERMVSFLMVFVVLIGLLSPGMKVYATSIDVELEEHLDLIHRGQVPEVGSIGGEWAIISLARSGYGVREGYYEAYYENVKKHIGDLRKSKKLVANRLNKNKSTENSRVILALTSIGKDPRNVEGVDLIQGLDDLTYLKRQGINGPIWALIALDSHGYDLRDLSREEIIGEILSSQNSDGGWGLSQSSDSDVDVSAMAIQSLGKYYGKNEDVSQAVDRALDYLSGIQNRDGGFNSNYGGMSSESVAQVLMALISLDKDHMEPDFIKERNILDVLKTFQVVGGGFKHTVNGGLNGMATEQATYALVARDRQEKGRTFIYDMSDVVFEGGGKEVEDDNYDFEEFKDFQSNGFKNIEIEDRYRDEDSGFIEMLPGGQVDKNKLWRIKFNKAPKLEEIEGGVIEGGQGYLGVKIARDRDDDKSLIIKSDGYEIGEYVLRVYLNNGNRYTKTFKIVE